MTTGIGHPTWTPLRRLEALYWVSTGLASLALIAVAAADVAHAPTIVSGLAHLGYPPYVATILGTWKLLGVATLLAPGLTRLKEWAYAGFFFLLTGAALSHGLVGDPLFEVFVPIVLLLFVLASWRLLPVRQEKAAAAALPQAA